MSSTGWTGFSISEDSPLDEHRRDELVERFQLTHQPGADHLAEDDVDDEEEDEEDELKGVEDLELGEE